MSRRIVRSLLKNLKMVWSVTIIADLNQAFNYWKDYQRTHKINPEVLEQEE